MTGVTVDRGDEGSDVYKDASGWEFGGLALKIVVNDKVIAVYAPNHWSSVYYTETRKS
jgi:hypothetical protein